MRQRRPSPLVATYSLRAYLAALDAEAHQRLARLNPELGYCDLVDSCGGCNEILRPVDVHRGLDRGSWASFVYVCFDCRRTWNAALPVAGLPIADEAGP